MLLAAAAGHIAIIRILLDAGCRPQSIWVDSIVDSHIIVTGTPTSLFSRTEGEAQPSFERANPLDGRPSC